MNSSRGEPPADPGIWRWKWFVQLLHFGVGLKRWAVMAALGVAVWSIGFAWLMRQFFDLKFPNFLPWYLEGFLLLIVGSGSILAAMYGFYRKLSPVLLGSQSIENMVDTIYTRWSRGKGPRIVAIGGGTGLSVLLRGLKEYTDNLTAIITVADDGEALVVSGGSWASCHPEIFATASSRCLRTNPYWANSFSTGLTKATD